MEGTEPGDSRRRGDGEPRHLAEPPSARYGSPGGGELQASPASPVGPLARASIVAILGAAVLIGVGAILASTAGLLFVSALTGVGIGLVLARARAPGGDGPAALSPRAVTGLAIGLAIGSVVMAALGTWLIARQEGGVLEPIDYLLTTFGPFVPGELLIAGLTAAWGARAGPIER